MKFVTVRDFRSQSAAVWKSLRKEEDMVITCNGKPIAVMSACSDTDLEASLSALRRARALRAVEAIQKQSVRTGKHRLDLASINTEIQAARKSR